MRKIVGIILACILGHGCMESGSSQGTSSVHAGMTVDEKVATALPVAEEETWLQIPWEANIMRARLQSQLTGKPMLVWVMEGDVLGCT